jgi:hypothetical protein
MQYELGSTAWYEMQEREVVAAFAHAGWSSDVRFTLVERFHGAEPFPDGRLQGFRVDVAGSTVTYRRGVDADETGDATVDITFEALRELVHLSSRDPAHAAAVERLTRSGDIVRSGRWEQLGDVSPAVHQRVFEQTL